MRSPGFHSSARWAAAQNFTMPALSPTMTEGSISKWNVKEGDSFAAGDVLLEIETDKATMDVEAQEDGVVMKIIQGDGSKAVQVGTRIGVLAEPGDDLATLEIPADENSSAAAPKASEAAKPEPKAPQKSEKVEGQPKVASEKAGGKIHKQTYPLMPSVALLVAENGLDESAIAKIPSTGPNGRLLKGDVLAYLGAITAGQPAAVSDMFARLSHLDLSNIKVAEKKAPPPAAKEKAPAPVSQDVQVALPISLAKALEVQKKIQSTLGVLMPLSTFIARATEVANDDLPASSRRPTSDELFDQVLGLDTARPSGTRGFYLPQVAALPPASLLSRPASSRQQDIIGFLAGSKKSTPRPLTSSPALAGANLFTLVVPKGDEKRATVFLERVKLILEQEPGRLVL